MDKEELQKKIALYYSKLTPGAQAIFSSMEWLEKLKKIAEQYNLSQNQIETLGTETAVVLLGIVSTEEYKNNLKLDLSLNSESLNSLVENINNSILNQISLELLQTFNENVKSLVEEMRDQPLDERFNKLSTDIQESIKESKYQEELYKISKENNLTVDQMNELEKITVNTILGIIHPDKFKDEIKKVFNFSEEKINKLINSVNEKVLRNIRNKMMGIETNTKEEKQNTVVLNSAGIQILDKKELPAGNTADASHRDSLLKDIEKTRTIHPMFTDKMTIPVQMTPSKTDHSLSNISKPLAVPVKPNSYLTKKDPYRLSPGE